MTSLPPPRGLAFLETLTDILMPLQELHLHLEHRGCFPYQSITGVPTGLVGYGAMPKSAGSFSNFDHTIHVKVSRQKCLRLFTK